MTDSAATPPDDSRSPFWSEPLPGLFQRLGSSPSGLDVDEAARRLDLHGPNVAAPVRHRGLVRLLAGQFASPITLLLLAAALLSIAVGETTDGLTIVAIIVVSGLLGFWQERRAGDAVEKLLALIRTTTTVVRGGAEREIPVDQVVPGDLVLLTAGSSVPGDARIVTARDLFADQAALTGESFPAEKMTGDAPAAAALADRTNSLFQGTHVVSGTATVLVVRTGRSTEFGAIAARLARRPAETEFERGIRRFGYLLLDVATVLVVTIFAINVALHRPVLDALLFTLALAVGLTPQLLPAIVSVTLAQGAHRMSRHRVIVRRLASIEDLGGMSILCTDKTGTITEGVVAVRGVEDFAGAPSERARLLAYLNAALETGFRNPVDDALRATVADGAADYTKVDEVPYDFVRKRLSVAVEGRGERLLITKGALPNVLDVCERAEDAAGRTFPLSTVRAAIDARFARLCAEGHRCLGVACRTVEGIAPVGRDDERGLTLVGLLVLSDPIKSDARAALDELSALGITVKLITGDHRLVAARAAGEAGLPVGEVLTGSDLRDMTDAALLGAASRTTVFAEVEPNQKERIILALKRAGHAVGFLGDGINDASALHAADVGISVDSASDVTRQAADIVLLEKDLAVLGHGVREGRQAFGNTLKYVFITTSANFGNMFSMAGASLFAAFLPLLPEQILLINVLTDLPAMAIATDRLDAEQVQRPRRWDTRSIRRFMLTFGLVSSLFDYLTFGTLLALGVQATTFRTAWFLESVLSELFILLVIRTRRSFLRSRPGTALLFGSVGVAVFTLLLPYSPLAGPLGFTPLPLRLGLLITGIVALYVAGSEATKRVFFRHVSL